MIKYNIIVNAGTCINVTLLHQGQIKPGKIARILKRITDSAQLAGLLVINLAYCPVNVNHPCIVQCGSKTMQNGRGKFKRDVGHTDAEN